MSTRDDEKRLDAALREALPHRLQSVILYRSEELAAYKVELGSKKFSSLTAGFDPGEWVNNDYPARENVAFKLPLKLKEALVDIDVDVKPLDGKWNAEKEARAGDIAQTIIRTIAKFADVGMHYAFGRASMGGWGHLLVNVLTPMGPDDRALLATLSRRPIYVPVGDMKVRLEVRLAPTPKKLRDNLKCFTAPGSLYKRYADHALYDLVRWTHLRSDLQPNSQAAPLPQVDMLSFVRGLWCGLLTVILGNEWIDGKRHDMALLVGGLLATEVESQAITGEPLFDEAQAEGLIGHICMTYGDMANLRDRVGCVRDSIAGRRSGQHVTGYTRFAQAVSEEAKDALLQLRGSNDPDTEALLLSRIVYARASVDTTGDTYLNLAVPIKVCVTQESLRRDFAHHPSFPARTMRNGKEQRLIEWAFGSKKLRQVDFAARLPGIDFKAYLVRDDNGNYRRASDGEIAAPGGEGLTINIAPGFRTRCPDAPTPRAWELWCRMWRRHLEPLTQGKKEARNKIERLIAFAVREPLKKVACALIMSAEQGLGKTTLFTEVLGNILGKGLVGSTDLRSLRDFPFQELAGRKFYVFEEMCPAELSPDMANLIKNFIKNTSLDVNIKYGFKGAIDNYAFGALLTNEENPGYLIAGQPDRSTAYIFGHTRASLGYTAAEFEVYRQKVMADIREFIHLLESDEEVREAGMFYFMEHIEEVTVDMLEDNTDLPLGAAADVRGELSALDQALCNIVEQNRFHSRYPGGSEQFPLTHPFTMDLLWRGVAEQQGLPPAKMKTNAAAISKRFNALLRHKQDGDNKAIERCRFSHNGKQQQTVYYITLKYGEIIRRMQDNLGVTIMPAYGLHLMDDFGANPPPEEADCITALEFRSENLNSNGLY